jgi:hypothetical protein
MIGALEAIKFSSADILRILRNPSTISPAGNATDRIDPTMFTYYVGKLFRRLDADERVSEEELAGLEWAYFNALQHSDRPARTLHKALSMQPKFFVQLISAVWSSKDDVLPNDPAASETARATGIQAFRVLDGWSRVPGTDDEGILDGAALEAWVNEARRLCAEAGRAEVGDSRIGRILSAAPRVSNEAWPPEPVRDIIELCRSRELEEGFQVGLYNRRGVTVRLPTDGGQQERELATRYRADALACAFTWPRTQSVLERIAEGYERDGMRQDQSAEQRDWM